MSINPLQLDLIRAVLLDCATVNWCLCSHLRCVARLPSGLWPWSPSSITVFSPGLPFCPPWRSCIRVCPIYRIRQTWVSPNFFVLRAFREHTCLSNASTREKCRLWARPYFTHATCICTYIHTRACAQNGLMNPAITPFYRRVERNREMNSLAHIKQLLNCRARIKTQVFNHLLHAHSLPHPSLGTEVGLEQLLRTDHWELEPTRSNWEVIASSSILPDKPPLKTL